MFKSAWVVSRCDLNHLVRSELPAVESEVAQPGQQGGGDPRGGRPCLVECEHVAGEAGRYRCPYRCAGSRPRRRAPGGSVDADGLAAPAGVRAGRLVNHREYRHPSSARTSQLGRWMRALGAGEHPHPGWPVGQLVPGRAFGSGGVSSVTWASPIQYLRWPQAAVGAGVPGAALADLAGDSARPAQGRR